MLKGVGRELPAGSYRVATDEELIEGLSFPVYRRVATMIFVPGHNRASLEMLTHRSGGPAGRAGAGCRGARRAGHQAGRLIAGRRATNGDECHRLPVC